MAERLQMGFDPDALLWCCCCGKQRPARDCVIYSYYDGPMVYCADGCGCKDPQVIAAKKAREFAIRSAAQKARWAKKSNVKVTGLPHCADGSDAKAADCGRPG